MTSRAAGSVPGGSPLTVTVAARHHSGILSMSENSAGASRPIAMVVLPRQGYPVVCERETRVPASRGTWTWEAMYMLTKRRLSLTE